ncbi:MULTISPECIES: CU044_2847 family protein [unclassified Streptomyces]|uniref:CU044_2847 family protein n=1 Tax=unclassified Streptomyces TaxID=2593676 RepID=UPI0033274413
MAYRVREVEIGGETVLARVETLDPDELELRKRPTEYGEEEEVTALDTLLERVDSVQRVIRSVGTSVLEAAREAARADEVSVSFGVELAAKSGKMVAFLADGEAKATLNVTLTWRPGDRSDGAVASVQGNA